MHTNLCQQDSTRPRVWPQWMGWAFLLVLCSEEKPTENLKETRANKEALKCVGKQYIFSVVFSAQRNLFCKLDFQFESPNWCGEDVFYPQIHNLFIWSLFPIFSNNNIISQVIAFKAEALKPQYLLMRTVGFKFQYCLVFEIKIKITHNLCCQQVDMRVLKTQRELRTYLIEHLYEIL